MSAPTGEPEEDDPPTSQLALAVARHSAGFLPCDMEQLVRYDISPRFRAVFGCNSAHACGVFIVRENEGAGRGVVVLTTNHRHL